MASGGDSDRVITIPVDMFAPVGWDTTGPDCSIAVANSFVVDVLPLVADTSAATLPCANSVIASGASRRMTCPPMTIPSPRPATRDNADAARPAPMAARVRRGNFRRVDVLTGAAYAERRPTPAIAGTAHCPVIARATLAP